MLRRLAAVAMWSRSEVLKTEAMMKKTEQENVELHVSQEPPHVFECSWKHQVRETDRFDRHRRTPGGTLHGPGPCYGPPRRPAPAQYGRMVCGHGPSPTYKTIVPPRPPHPLGEEPAELRPLGSNHLGPPGIPLGPDRPLLTKSSKIQVGRIRTTFLGHLSQRSVHTTQALPFQFFSTLTPYRGSVHPSPSHPLLPPRAITQPRDPLVRGRSLATVSAFLNHWTRGTLSPQGRQIAERVPSSSGQFGAHGDTPRPVFSPSVPPFGSGPGPMRPKPLSKDRSTHVPVSLVPLSLASLTGRSLEDSSLCQHLSLRTAIHRSACWVETN